MKNSKGITLIALIITIIVMLILVGITISVVFNGGIIDNTKEAAFKTDMTKIAEMLESHKADKYINNVIAGIVGNSNITMEAAEVDAELGDIIPIYLKTKISMIDGDWYYNPQGDTNTNHRKWAVEVGYKILGDSEGEQTPEEPTQEEPMPELYTYQVINETEKTAGITGIKGDYKQQQEEYLSTGMYFFNIVDKDNDNEVITSITIPSEVEIEGEEYTITAIGYQALFLCKSLNSITIPNNITNIGQMAFAACTNLSSITIPDSVTYMGESAFNHCHSLTSITILSNSITMIRGYTFNYCTSLQSITIPSGVTYIDVSAFDYCGNLNNVIIPNTVTHIDYYAFRNCTSLQSITIPASVTEIESAAFGNCTNLANINLRGATNSITGSPWGASNATITWNYTGE